MELDWLQTFVIAADTENFRATAEALHLAQPTVSLHVQKLEQHLSVQLFERTGRTVRLSPAGQRYLMHARRLLTVYQDGREDMLRWRQGYEESVTIAVSPLIATTVLPRWIQRYTETHPAVQFSVQVTESGAIESTVLSGHCDLGLTRLQLSHAHIECLPLYADPIVMVAPADAPDWDGPALVAADLLQQYPVLTHNHPEYWDSLLPALRKYIPYTRTMQVSQVHVTIQWIVDKLGVSFLPASTVQRDLLRGTLAEVPFDSFPLPVAHSYIVRNKVESSKSAQSFAAFVQEYMREREF